ncbi:NRPS condensation-like uncharacterized protein [Ruminiclostridium sufflavum DSM 19573]|uniref:NRPS condensation-like uncharacterized protein n=1 Tax=Ruminiclostridium sufflavum DSM 19573 TaxID=1121337 RepID=A0A318XIS1_9FIRM|nr:hypothetical protein [Ruminiclostridium sufflavum]PYG85733.1 NRPS condensation-like uncharacterized protein [Ruminiclostridium sufflavum DSM 19573]
MKYKTNSEIRWHKLDNTANVFPVISNKTYSSVFRVSVRLKNEINGELLQEALVNTLPLFRSFGVKLKRGVFWHYFETNKKQPKVEREQEYPCAFIDPNSNNQFLFKVTYFAKRINLEVFHVITDGTGALKFLKALTYNYIKLAYKEILSEILLKMPVVDVVSDVEDSYHKNYRKHSYPRYKTKRAYKLKGDMLPVFTMGVIHGIVNMDLLLALCKKKNVSLTQYIAALLIWCIYKEYMNEQANKKPVQVNVPVNLRHFFSSTTEMNFFSYINVGITSTKSEYTFDEMLDSVSGQFEKQLTKENLSQTISSNVSTEKNIFVRFSPLVLKQLGVKIAYVSSTKANTVVLSNLGKIEVCDGFKEYIDGFEALIGVSKSEPIKCTICSFDNRIIFSFTSILRYPYLQRAFFRHLSDEGLEVRLESNGVYYENM